MFNTIKSKIVLITIFMLFTLTLLLSVFSFIYLKSGKSLILQEYSFSISVFAQNINKDIIKIENNAKDLALHGEMFFQIDKNRSIAEETIIKIFENYTDSLGGGIWFKPYKLHKNQKLFCIYTYRNKSGEVLIDRSFEGEDYNYPNQSWYKEIMSQLSKEHNTAWSLPYYEKEGSNTLMVTAGSGIYSNNELVGLSTVDWEISSIVKSISEMKPTEGSFSLFADKTRDYIIVSTDPFLNNGELVGKSLYTIPWYNENLKNITYFDYNNRKYVPYVKNLDNGMLYIVCIPKNELFELLYKHVNALCIGLLLICFLISVSLYIGLQKNINKPITKLINIANRIRRGDLEAKIELKKPEEFAKLAETFNKMTSDITSITKERERIESELSLAKEIQASSLPNLFPPFPNRKEFDIYAGMEPAKEVGGDFYDFYFIDDTHFMFLIADVSGKGVPAALFMMNIKTLINFVAQMNLSPQEMIETINNRICSNNKYGFFVTLIAGIIDVSTGKTTLINCGHNPPLLKNNNAKYEYLKLNPNIVLGAFENTAFETEEIQLSPSDTIILYTDGITEAINSDNEMYGEEKLCNTVNTLDDSNIESFQNLIKHDIKVFTEGNSQSDDMTMLILRFNGSQKEDKEYYKNLASIENYKTFYEWIETISDKYKLSEEIKHKIILCSEEIYTNIASYAYGDNSGDIEVIFQKEADSVKITFKDSGFEYNPLLAEDPDVELPPKSRDIGGLGVYIVKNTVDDIYYARENSQNVLTLIINA